VNYIRGIAHVDTWPLAATLYPRLDLFKAVTLRQDYPGSPHKETRMIPLRVPAPLLTALAPMPPHLDPSVLAALWFEDVPHANTPILDGWPEATALFAGLSTVLMRGAVGKVMLVELAPGGSLAWHKDEGAYAQAHMRFHLPLVTNPMAFLLAGGEQAHVPVGALTFFDTSVLHSAINLGETPRVHLIVDVRRGG
jgi:hypothetical protein